MPRPTPAQLTYGSVTVVFSTLAMLLLSEARSGIGVVVVAAAGLVLGVLVAMTVPIPLSARAKARTAAAVTPPSAPGTAIPRVRIHSNAEPRVSEHSLRR
ncbi:hypothetical protein [Streptomyces sp. NBC_01262]|jgi:hydrogenase/urease accessory protein HupE|uniref:hypothetical protein n=1 Tax=Streptomyces sp. NBC_01262 TaxID=2903803 RepID=UPI002E30AEC4|nr:hypothetical protein [Streptomyces sp. NBC_01262]